MTHLRKMMLEELERRNYAQTTTRICADDRGIVLRHSLLVWILGPGL